MDVNETAVATEICYLVRCGIIPEVIRCKATVTETIQRSENVVVESPRGLQLGTVIDYSQKAPSSETEYSGTIQRVSSLEDERNAVRLQEESEGEFADWCQRIEQWKIDLQLVEMERTLDGEKRILYVLNDRGPECTKLALQAAAAGLGAIEVQPVSSEGLVPPTSSGGGCGSGGCGCNH